MGKKFFVQISDSLTFKVFWPQKLPETITSLRTIFFSTVGQKVFEVSREAFSMVHSNVRIRQVSSAKFEQISAYWFTFLVQNEKFFVKKSKKKHRTLVKGRRNFYKWHRCMHWKFFVEFWKISRTCFQKIFITSRQCTKLCRKKTNFKKTDFLPRWYFDHFMKTNC